MAKMVRLTRVADERRLPLLINLDHVVAVTEANDDPQVSIVYVSDGTRYVVVGTVDSIERITVGKAAR